MSEDRPDIEQAKAAAAESARRAERDMQQARMAARRHRTLAERLRELREANGFSSLLDDAFGGGHA